MDFLGTSVLLDAQDTEYFNLMEKCIQQKQVYRHDTDMTKREKNFLYALKILKGKKNKGTCLIYVKAFN